MIRIYQEILQRFSRRIPREEPNIIFQKKVKMLFFETPQTYIMFQRQDAGKVSRFYSKRCGHNFETAV